MKARIVLVEDERIVALHVRQQLSKLGYEVPAIAASAEQALQKSSPSAPTLC